MGKIAGENPTEALPQKIDRPNFLRQTQQHVVQPRNRLGVGPPLKAMPEVAIR